MAICGIYAKFPRYISKLDIPPPLRMLVVSTRMTLTGGSPDTKLDYTIIHGYGTHYIITDMSVMAQTVVGVRAKEKQKCHCHPVKDRSNI